MFEIEFLHLKPVHVMSAHNYDGSYVYA
jgi:hypothetical protein